VRVTLQEAVALAVRQSPALSAAGAELSAAQGSSLSASGLDDPLLSAAGTYRLRRGPALSAPDAPPRAEASVALQLTQPLASGGQLALGLDTSYAQAAPEAALPAASRWTPALQLWLTQPLLRGAGSRVARAEQRRAGAALDLASAERASVAAALLRDVVSGYWQLAHAERQLHIRRATAGAARAQLARVQANIAVGKLPPSATAEIEVVIVLREDAVLLAEQALAESELALARLCAMPAGVRLQPSDALPAVDPAAPARSSLAETLAAALAHSPQLQALRARGRGAAVELEVSEDGLLPQLDVGLGGGPLGSSAGARAAYAELASFGGYTAFASVSLELPIVRRTARGAVQLARGRWRRAQLDEAGVAAQIRAAVSSGLAQLDTARRRAALLVPSQSAAALDLEAEQARFEVGRASNFDVLRRQDALAAVQQLLLGAQLQQLEAQAALGSLTGELFVRHGIVLGAAAP
jgi:outer membrane protein TolC